MNRFLLLLIMFVLTFADSSAQSDSINYFKPSILKYHEFDAPYVLDFGGLAGPGTGVIQYGLAVNLDVYHILIGYNYVSTIPIKEKISQSSFLLGYRYRTERFMAAIASGAGWQKYTCTSGSNYDCYQYAEGREFAIPLNIQTDFILSDNFALGITFHNTFSDRKTMSGILFALKFGAFREY